MAEQRTQAGPEAAPDRATAGRRAAMRSVDVILAVEVTGDRRDLVRLDDQVGLELLDGVPRLFRGALIGMANRNERFAMADSPFLWLLLSSALRFDPRPSQA